MKLIRLTEGDLHRMVKESVKRVLTEKAWVNPYQQYMQNDNNGFTAMYDGNNQAWKTDVFRLNAMLNRIQTYCPYAARSIKSAISQIYKTMGTNGLQQQQQPAGQQQPVAPEQQQPVAPEQQQPVAPEQQPVAPEQQPPAEQQQPLVPDPLKQFYERNRQRKQQSMEQPQQMQQVQGMPQQQMQQPTSIDNNTMIDNQVQQQMQKNLALQQQMADRIRRQKMSK